MKNRKRKLEIEADLIKNPDDVRYTFITPQKMKSDVWKNFKLLKFKQTIENFARCNFCKEILVYSAKSGTGSLLRHKCVRKSFAITSEHHKLKSSEPFQCSSGTQQTLSQYTINTLPENAKNKIKKQQVRFITKDLRPLNITEEDGFKKFGQALINIGAEYGHQNIENILTSKKTLAHTIIPAEYDRIKNELETILSKNQLSFTTDIWTDEYTQQSFLTLTAHYINEKFEFKTNILGTREFLLDKKVGANIHDFVLKMLFEFKIEDKINSGYMVTDNKPNVVAAFRNYKRLSCACHNLNLVMEDVLEKQKIEELEILVVASKKLVGFFKDSELNSKLTKPLKQHVKTGWNSMYIMLSSIFEMYTEIQTLLIERKRNELYKIEAINHYLLECLIEFLEPFKDCSEQLSSDLIPTIHVYSLWFEKLMKHCIEKPLDSEVIAELKSSTIIALKKRFQPTRVHNVALFLNPPYKRLSFMSEAQRNHVIEIVKSMLEEYEHKETQIKLEDDENEPGPSTSNDPFDEFKDKYDNYNCNSNASDKNIEAELHIYLNKQVSNCDVLEFWRNALDLPRLQTLSRRILNISSSSTASEKLFSSTSARILEERRIFLFSENSEQILFLNKNM